LRERGWQGAYTGLDVSDKMLDVSKGRLPNDSFYNVDILEDDLEGTYDSIICVATLQQKPAFQDASEYLKQMIEKMFSMAQKTVIFDVFSNRFADHLKENNVYADPVELCEYCYSLTNRLVVVNNYNPYQMMIVLYKERINGWIDVSEKEQNESHRGVINDG
jgi:hypothetical protein